MKVSFTKFLDTAYFFFYKYYLKNRKRKGEIIFFFGNQKSGTTAISYLLSLATGTSFAYDPKWLYEPVFSNIYYRNISFEKAVLDSGTRDLKRKIFKDPSLVLIIQELKEIYPDAKFFQIIRHPIDNIQSILKRLNLPGDVSNLKKSELGLSPEWNNIVFNDWLGIHYENHIESMAKRWVLFYELYKSNQDKITLLKYEDFLKNKELFIYNLIDQCDLEKRKDISSFVNHNFQTVEIKSGKSKYTLSPANIKVINQICSDSLRELGYLSGE